MVRKTYLLPAKFTLDYLLRFEGTDLYPEGEEQKLALTRKGNRVSVCLTGEQARDLLADAEYYADTPTYGGESWWDESVRPLNNSAKRVLKALQEQM